MQRDCALDTGKLYYQTFTSMKNYQNVFALFGVEDENPF